VNTLKFEDEVEEALNYWQNDPNGHPMTCLYHSGTKLMVERAKNNGVYMYCPKCTYIQIDFPPSLLMYYDIKGTE